MKCGLLRIRQKAQRFGIIFQHWNECNSTSIGFVLWDDDAFNYYIQHCYWNELLFVVRQCAGRRFDSIRRWLLIHFTWTVRQWNIQKFNFRIGQTFCGLLNIMRIKTAEQCCWIPKYLHEKALQIVFKVITLNKMTGTYT